MASFVRVSLLPSSTPLACVNLVNKGFGFSGVKRILGLGRLGRQVHLEELPSCFSRVTGNRQGSLLRRRAYSTNIVTSRLQIDLVPCLQDNYAYLLHDTNAGVTAIVDPSAAGPVINALKEKGLSLDFILNTHHHWDHTGGNAALKREYDAKASNACGEEPRTSSLKYQVENLTQKYLIPSDDIFLHTSESTEGLAGYWVVGPRADEDRIPGIDISLRDGEKWTLGEHVMHVLDTPGHTRGHVSYYFPDSAAVFTGDTLFSMGCGRLFEGSPEQMWSSLLKLSELPDETLVYCGHEYTLSNAKFAISVEPQNQALLSRYKEVAELRRKGLPTIPSTLGEEKKCNPFLRPFSLELKKSVNLNNFSNDIETFAAVRRAKDTF